MRSDEKSGDHPAENRAQDVSTDTRTTSGPDGLIPKTDAAWMLNLFEWEEKKLSVVEENASRAAKVADGPRKTHAQEVLQAIAEERRRRGQAAAKAREQHVSRVSETVRDKGLEARVILAFQEIRPEQWETEVLREIAASPGNSGTQIAQAIGKREVGYINLAVGTLCSNRELYLGPAPAAGGRPGFKKFSALLIDFTSRMEPDGSRSTGWTLKPAAHAALKTLNIVN